MGRSRGVGYLIPCRRGLIVNGTQPWPSMWNQNRWKRRSHAGTTRSRELFGCEYRQDRSKTRYRLAGMRQKDGPVWQLAALASALAANGRRKSKNSSVSSVAQARCWSVGLGGVVGNWLGSAAGARQLRLHGDRIRLPSQEAIEGRNPLYGPRSAVGLRCPAALGIDLADCGCCRAICQPHRAFPWRRDSRHGPQCRMNSYRSNRRLLYGLEDAGLSPARRVLPQPTESIADRVPARRPEQPCPCLAMCRRLLPRDVCAVPARDREDAVSGPRTIWCTPMSRLTCSRRGAGRRSSGRPFPGW